MKTATLIAIISLIILLVVSLVEVVLTSLKMYSQALFTVLNVAHIIAVIGLLQFFIKLYSKQKG